MKPISVTQILELRNAPQHFHDCYLVSSINALTRCKNGINILRQNIQTTNNGYRIRFNNVFGKQEDYFVTEEECKMLTLCDNYANEIPVEQQHNPIIKAIEVAMNKLIRKHPTKKPLISRLVKCNEKFEYNKPSNFLEMFTGRKPIELNEGTLMRMTLKQDKEKAIELLDKMYSEEDFCFVAGTGINYSGELTNTNCYTITRVNNKYENVDIKDNKLQKSIRQSYDQFIREIKYIVGYFNDQLV